MRASSADKDTSANSLRLAGNSAFREGRFEEAQHLYSRALSATPPAADRHLLLGNRRDQGPWLGTKECALLISPLSSNRTLSMQGSCPPEGWSGDCRTPGCRRSPAAQRQVIRRLRCFTCHCTRRNVFSCSAADSALASCTSESSHHGRMLRNTQRVTWQTCRLSTDAACCGGPRYRLGWSSAGMRRAGSGRPRRCRPSDACRRQSLPRSEPSSSKAVGTAAPRSCWPGCGLSRKLMATTAAGVMRR